MSRRRGERRGPIIAPRFYIITRNWRILSLSLSLFDPLSPSSRDLSSVSFRLNGPGNFREGEKSFEKRKEREGERIDKEAKGRKEETIVLFEQRYLESIIYNFSRRPSFDLDERCRWGEQDN